MKINNKNIIFYLMTALAFAIPIYDRLVVFLIALIVLNWLIQGKFVKRFKLLISSKNRLFSLSFCLLYFIYLIGIIYSKNMEYAWFDVQVKLSILIFPLIFSTLEEDMFTRERINHFFYSYLFGCLLITLIVLIHAFFTYKQTNSMVDFYYTGLSAFQHPSYFSMNLNFGIALIIMLLIRSWNDMKGWMKSMLIFLIPYFFLIIMLLSSKAGIISLLMIMVVSMASLIIYKKEYLIGLLFLFLLPFIFIGAYYAFPNSFYRLAVAGNYVSGNIPLNASSDDGTNERLLVWKSSLEIVKDHPLTGVGTGDVKDVLLKKYAENHITAAINKRLNAHNQFLQTFVALGFIGLLVLLVCLFAPAIGAVKQRDLLYFLFLMIIGINFLGESMLERQAGVVFYSFFNSFLFFIRQKGGEEGARG